MPSTTTKKPMTTTTGNRIATPTPTQDGMVFNCDALRFLKLGGTCQSTANANGTTPTQFTTRSLAGSSCLGLWLDAHVCESIIGHTRSKLTTATTPDGCATAHPTPTQPGSICACNQWYKPAKKEYCADIEKKFGITASQFNKWNPEVGLDWKGLWMDHNVCVKA
ncbi:hypothetical protein F5B22DRAFT_646604 [Xylaria bambusicola]|uniref:uncharacterized protein n=1 Tax=Xylaria bambusicola TaxID=326684 RepID=UPI002007C77E|nr:uncharacterized protein F5B22DRAFT_646604 [Xylaria bambusicola]KAI0516870.1 hypothetical protein F5B22DRAFT_646604 [Xylaria bambusicola]